MPPVAIPRPKNLDEMKAVLGELWTDESSAYAASFVPRPTDVIINPFAKSGTTWTQQIVYGLKTRGSMDFEEITEATPWISIAHQMGWDLNADQAAFPRVFKSHNDWGKIPKGCRYICSFRAPEKVLVSFYRFFEDWIFERHTVSLTDFAHLMLIVDPEKPRYWNHLASWWEQRDNKNVLLLCYEDMVQAPIKTIERIADFIGIKLDADLLDIVTRQSTREFMLEHASQFDEHLVRQNIERRVGLSANGGSGKITDGNTDSEHYQIPTALQEELDTLWHETIETRFGFPDYDAFCKALREHSQQ